MQTLFSKAAFKMFKTNIKGAVDRFLAIKEKEKCMHLKTVVEPKFCLNKLIMYILEADLVWWTQLISMHYKVPNLFGVEGNS